MTAAYERCNETVRVIEDMQCEGYTYNILRQLI